MFVLFVDFKLNDELVVLQGCKIKMDDSGNILIKRIAKTNVYVKNTEGETAVANEIIKLPVLLSLVYLFSFYLHSNVLTASKFH